MRPQYGLRPCRKRAMEPLAADTGPGPVRSEEEGIVSMAFSLRPTRWTRIVLAVFLLIWLAAPTWHGYTDLFRPPDPIYDWNVLYWLVPWPGRFVRRGLNGEILLFLSGATGLDPRWIVIGLLFVAAALLAVLLWRWGRVVPVLALPLLVHPAGLTFHVLDPWVVLRHELFLYVIFALEWDLVLRGSVRAAMGLAVAAALLWPLLHEGIALFVPWLLLPLFAARPDPDTRRFAGLFLMLWVGTLLAVAAAGQAGSGTAVVHDICEEIRARAPELPGLERCEASEPMRFYTGGVGAAVSGMLSAIAQGAVDRNFHQALALWLLSAVLYAVLVRALVWEQARDLMRTDLPVAYLPALAAPLALFLLGYDWGRWLHIFHVLLAIHVLARWTLTVGDRDLPPSRADAALPRGLVAVAWATLVLQPLFWRLQHFKGAEPGLLWLLQKSGARAVLALIGPA